MACALHEKPPKIGHKTQKIFLLVVNKQQESIQHNQKTLYTPNTGIIASNKIFVILWLARCVKKPKIGHKTQKILLVPV